MPNKNLDSLREQLKSTSSALAAAMTSGDGEKITACLEEYGKSYNAYHNDGMLEQISEQLDKSVLTARGIRPITTEEREFANSFISAHKSTDVKQALSGVPLALPQTIIDTIIDDMRTNHPLLNHVDLRTTEFNVKTLYSEDGAQKAVWGAITDKIKTELSLTIKTLDTTQNKLTAFIPVPKGYLDFSAEWLVSLIISMLSEAFALGLENGIINGTGKNEPIGMTKDLKGSVVEGVYPNKTPIKVTAINQETYPALVAKLAKTESGKSRSIPHVLLICNPEDYLTKICPATTVLRTDGGYSHDVFPFPTVVVQSAEVAAGKAILGIDKGYIQTVGTATNGAVTYDDSCQFLDDNRVYAIKGYGNGKPKDNNSFIVLDISKLEVLLLAVKLVNSDANTGA